jgi:Transglycosylase-like domain/Putative peptidoglycan binding domain
VTTERQFRIVHTNEEPLRAPARDLADPTHARHSLRDSLDRRLRRARRRRVAGGGRRAVVVATCTLALGAAGAAAQEQAGESDDRRSSPASSTAVQAGYNVRALQRKIGVRADGRFGPKTRRALKRWQRRHGLQPDGVVGPRTLKALGLSRSKATARSAGTSGAQGDNAALLARIAECESGGDPTAVSPNGRYRGKYQFSRPTWKSLGGEGDPAQASEGEQDLRAAALLERQGPSAWPVCSKR